MTRRLQSDHTYSPKELEDMLAGMTAASGIFYELAVATRCHAFIEFTGLQNEYIKLCREALDQGIDFTQTNVHSDKSLPMKGYHAEYLTEKLACIYGNVFATDPEVAYVFFSRAMGARGPRQVLVALARLLDEADGQKWATRLRNRLENAVHEYDALREGHDPDPPAPAPIVGYVESDLVPVALTELLPPRRGPITSVTNETSQIAYVSWQAHEAVPLPRKERHNLGSGSTLRLGAPYEELKLVAMDDHGQPLEIVQLSDQDYIIR
jgi:hypothetical protein